MKNRKKVIVLGIQIIAIIIFVMSYKSYTDTVLKPIKVYMWAHELGEGVQIKESDVIEGTVSSTDYQANMILVSDAKSIIGKYTNTRVYPETYSYYKQVGEQSVKTSELENLDLTNARVISIPCSTATDAGGYISEGDKIDLMYTASDSATIVNKVAKEDQEGNSNVEGSASFTYSKIFMQEVVVFRTLTSSGYKTNHKADRYSGEAVQGVDISTEEANPDSGNIAILLIIVTPEQAEEIKTRQAKGTITIVKRFEESETHETLGYVMGNYGKKFAGHGNAETGSLQIVSTIQDTDDSSLTGTEVLQNENVIMTETTGESEVNNNSSTDMPQNSVSAVIGTDSIE